MEKTDENSITARLKLFIEHSGMSNSQFADWAGIPRPTLSQLIHGRNKSVNDLLLRKLHDNFPNLNISWLLFGVGSMTDDSNIKFSEVQNGSKPSIANIHTVSSQDESDTILFNDNIQQGSSNVMSEPENTDFGAFSAFAANLAESRPANDNPTLPSPPPGKKIKSIIVLYTDSSFEVFSPDKTEI